jgi:hypothetical protein
LSVPIGCPLLCQNPPNYWLLGFPKDQFPPRMEIRRPNGVPEGTENLYTVGGPWCTDFLCQQCRPWAHPGGHFIAYLHCYNVHLMHPVVHKIAARIL